MLPLAACGGGGGASGDTTGEGSSTDASTTATATSASTTQTATSEESTSAADSSSSGGDPLCPAPMSCVEPAPDGWDGPFARNPAGEGEQQCGGAFDLLVATLHADFMVDPTVCECACDIAGDALCDGIQLRLWDDDQCADPATTYNLDTGGTCNATVAASASAYWTATAMLGSTCTPDPTETFPEATFGSSYSLCEAELAECRDGSPCLPGVNPPFDAVCISKAGEQACPAESGYTEQLVVYEDIADTRSCSECTCDEPSGCTGYVAQLHSNDACSMLAGQITTSGTCQQGGAAVVTAAKVGGAGDPVISCDGAASPVMPMGDAVPSGPVTLCCRP